MAAPDYDNPLGSTPLLRRYFPGYLPYEKAAIQQPYVNPPHHVEPTPYNAPYRMFVDEDLVVPYPCLFHPAMHTRWLPVSIRAQVCALVREISALPTRPTSAEKDRAQALADELTAYLRSWQATIDPSTPEESMPYVSLTAPSPEPIFRPPTPGPDTPVVWTTLSASQGHPYLIDFHLPPLPDPRQHYDTRYAEWLLERPYFLRGSAMQRVNLDSEDNRDNKARRMRKKHINSGLPYITVSKAYMREFLSAFPLAKVNWLQPTRLGCDSRSVPPQFQGMVRMNALLPSIWPDRIPRFDEGIMKDNVTRVDIRMPRHHTPPGRLKQCDISLVRSIPRLLRCCRSLAGMTTAHLRPIERMHPRDRVRATLIHLLSRKTDIDKINAFLPPDQHLPSVAVFLACKETRRIKDELWLLVSDHKLRTGKTPTAEEFLTRHPTLWQRIYRRQIAFHRLIRKGLSPSKARSTLARSRMNVSPTEARLWLQAKRAANVHPFVCPEIYADDDTSLPESDQNR